MYRSYAVNPWLLSTGSHGKPNTGSTPTKAPPVNKRGGSTDGGKDPGCNPASGCCNCKNAFDVLCQMGKVSCEFTTSVMGTSNAFQQGLNKAWIPIVAIGGVIALIIFVVLKK